MPVSGKAKIAIVDRSEEWVPVPDLPFEVTRSGRVRRVFQIEYIVHGIGADSHGYPRVKCNRTSYHVHKLIAAAFLGSCPEGFQINHKDGNKKNWLPENLEYVTAGENVRHARNLKSWRDVAKVHLTVAQRIALCELASEGVSIRRLAQVFGVNWNTAQRIVRGTSVMRRKNGVGW